jgi:hypothetical protein
MLGLQGDNLGSMLSLNISLWWRTFVFRCVPVGKNKLRLREQSGGNLKRRRHKSSRRRLEERRWHKQYVEEDYNLHLEGGLRGVWSNQKE